MAARSSVGAASAVVLACLRGIEHVLASSLTACAKLVRAAEQADDFAELAMVRDRRNLEDVRQDELRVAMFRIFFEQLVEHLARFGAYLSKKSLRSALSRCARSRRVRSGALKARWQSRSKGSASGCLRCFGQFVEVDTALFKRLR